MATGAARARLGEHLQFDEATGAAIPDGGDHVGFRHVETAANDTIRTAANRRAAAAGTGAILFVDGGKHGKEGLLKLGLNSSLGAAGAGIKITAGFWRAGSVSDRRKRNRSWRVVLNG
jgi:hypothetical protein